MEPINLSADISRPPIIGWVICLKGGKLDFELISKKTKEQQLKIFTTLLSCVITFIYFHRKYFDLTFFFFHGLLIAY